MSRANKGVPKDKMEKIKAVKREWGRAKSRFLNTCIVVLLLSAVGYLTSFLSSASDPVFSESIAEFSSIYLAMAMSGLTIFMVQPHLLGKCEPNKLISMTQWALGALIAVSFGVKIFAPETIFFKIIEYVSVAAMALALNLIFSAVSDLFRASQEKSTEEIRKIKHEN